MSHEFRNSTEFCETFSRKKFCLSLRQTCINEFLKCSYLTPVKLGCLVLNGCILFLQKFKKCIQFWGSSVKNKLRQKSFLCVKQEQNCVNEQESWTDQKHELWCSLTQIKTNLEMRAWKGQW